MNPNFSPVEQQDIFYSVVMLKSTAALLFNFSGRKFHFGKKREVFSMENSFLRDAQFFGWREEDLLKSFSSRGFMS